MNDDARLAGLVEGIRSMHESRSSLEAWTTTLEAVGRWGHSRAIRRLVRAARRDLVRERSTSWCRAAAGVLDSIDDSRRWAVIDFAAVGIRSTDVMGLWSPGLPAALRIEGVDAPDAAVLVNVGPLVRSSLPAVCRSAPADIALADEAAGMIVLAVAIHEAAHHVAEAAGHCVSRPTLAGLRLAVPSVATHRPDHHDAAWCHAVAILTARAVRSIAPRSSLDWPSWLWDAATASLTSHAGIPGGVILDTLAEATRRPWHCDPAGDPPAALADLFQRQDDAAQPGEAAA